MALPYDLYIRYLASLGLDELAAMNILLAKAKLHPVGQETLDKAWEPIYSLMPQGVISQIESKCYSVDFLPHMKVLEVSDMWEETPDGTRSTKLKVVLGILDDASLRITINALLAKGLKSEEITRAVNAKYSSNLREDHVDMYMRYFFDPRRMTRSSWKSYLKVISAKERNILFMALTEPIEVVKTELDLPAQINVSETLQWLITKSFHKAKTYMGMGTPESDQSARAWIDQIAKLTDKYEKYRSADQSDFAKSLQMEFDFIDEDFGSPDEDMIKERASSVAKQDSQK
jgi:hypothetical protein